MPNPVPKGIKPAFPVHVERDDVRSKLLELLGIEKLPEKPAFTEDSTQVHDGMRLVRGSFQNPLGEAVPTIIISPEEAQGQPMPGVVCIDGTAGDAERMANLNFYRLEPRTGPLIGWARELARRGFVTIGITPKGSEVRRQSAGNWAEENKLLGPYGRPQMGILVEEMLQAARILADTDGVASDRIGLTGMSLGGNATWYSMACAPWIRAAAPICGGVGSLARVIHEAQVERHSAYYFVPHMLRYFDHAEVVAACIAPRPFMMVSPTQDEDMPRSGVDDLIPIVAPVYDEMGYPEHFAVHQPEGKHVFMIEYFELMVDWFKRYLAE